MPCAGYAPFSVSPAQDAVLDAIIERAQPGSVAVLDLDGCLFDNRSRQVHIIHEFAAQADHPALCRVERAHFSDWSLSRALRAAGVAEDVVAAVRGPLRSFWADRFFTSEYVAHDLAMPGAVRLARAVHAAGAHIAYLTGRDCDMHQGSHQALCRFGFPVPGQGATLLTKPDPRMSDEAWKRAAVSSLFALGRPAIFLDNEPANANLFHQLCPDALVVFVSSDHSFRPDLADPSLPVIRGFLRTSDRGELPEGHAC